MHGADALFAAKEIYHTMGVIRHIGADKTPSVAIRRMLYESMLRDLLLVRQYRVEVYENKGVSGKNQWRMYKKVCAGAAWCSASILTPQGSPGNLQMFEDDLFENSSMNTTSCIVAAKVAVVGGQRVRIYDDDHHH